MGVMGVTCVTDSGKEDYEVESVIFLAIWLDEIILLL